jgi:hypothetical protein
MAGEASFLATKKANVQAWKNAENGLVYEKKLITN